jgi:hypothetical protein
MPKKTKRDARIQRADHRRRTNLPSPPVAEIQQELMRQLTPAMFAQARRAHSHLNLRDRVLNLATMCAIVVSIVWRQIPSLSEVLRLLSQENLLWVETTTVSLTALSKRFERLPAALFATLFEQLVAQQAEQRRTAEMSRAETAAGSSRHRLALLQKIYTCLWIADASTLERLRKTTTTLRQHSAAVLGGKLLMIVEALTHLPVQAFFEEDAKANEKRFCERILAALPLGGLIIFDSGFCCYEFFDAFTTQKKYFLTRAKANMSYRSVRLLSQGARYRDEIIEVGLYRGSRCEHQVRMVSVLWGRTWYRYLSNELDAQRLSAEQVAALYRQRWRIEDAFLLTKRLLGLSYLWVGSPNGIEMQIYATLIFYTVLIGVCNDLAEALDVPLERISVEMVFRSFYHYSRACQRDVSTELIPFLCKHSKLFALIKTERKRHRQRDEQLAEIWADS